LATRLKMKRVPELRFFPDSTLDAGNHMETLLAELEQERAARPPEPEAEAAPDPDAKA
jgi:ribosome-binding factor A